jgi:hypothetical protein
MCRRLHLFLGLALVAAAAALWFTNTSILAGQKTGTVFLRSAKSGPWSAAATWEGNQVPPTGSKVQIRQGHTVTYDLADGPAIRFIHVAGSLTFARDKNTRLEVGLIAIQPGDDASENGFDCDAHVPVLAAGEARPALEVGTLNQPIDAKYTATIRLKYFDGQDKQSCPAIVCCGGRMDFHGAPLSRTWLKLGAPAKKGDADIMLSEQVQGWKAGDRIIITARENKYEGGTRRPGAKNKVDVQTE